jgi:hypothetical protein
MFDWLIKNKEWVFSGIGVSTILFLILNIKRRYKKHAKPSTNTTTSQFAQIEGSMDCSTVVVGNGNKVINTATDKILTHAQLHKETRKK